MDFFLFVLLLCGFAAMYVALQIYFIYTIIILVTIALFYVVIRFPRGKEDWPWGFTDNLYLVGMTNVIILVFTFVVPDCHFIGSQLMFPAPNPPEGWELVFDMRNGWVLLSLMVILAAMWLFIFAILVPHMQRSISSASAGGGASSGEWEKESSKPKVGMGA